MPTKYKMVRFLEGNTNRARREPVLFHYVNYEDIVLINGLCEGQRMTINRNDNHVDIKMPFPKYSRLMIRLLRYERIGNSNLFRFVKMLPENKRIEQERIFYFRAMMYFVAFVAMLILQIVIH